MTRLSVDTAKPAELARLLDLSGDALTDWSGDDLAGVFRHQLEVPLGELSASTGGGGASSGSSGFARFGDLLYEPDPPIELLEKLKQFAKACRSRDDGTLPAEVATALYYASIAAALVRCGRRITGLGDGSLREGFAWGREQAWLDEPTRDLFSQAVARLEASGPA